MSNAVVKKIVYSVSVVLASPLSVSKGDGVLTDSDVLVNGEGIPFIPGSTLAGAMRGYLEIDKQKDCIFGYENMKTQKGRMSSLFVSDLFFDGKVNTAIRDGVALSKNKTVLTQGKFDMEVVDTGAKGTFYLELVVRKNDNEEEFRAQLDKVFTGWITKEIRLGSKKSRGYGEIKLESVFAKEFTASNILEYKDAYVKVENHDDSWMKLALDQISTVEAKYVTISLPLRLEGGISIRQYAARKHEPDSVHITANGKPVIPGTSFAGAIRHRLITILEDLKVLNCKEIIDSVFGYVNPGKDGDAHISDIIIGECILEGSEPLISYRNAISRFEASVKEEAFTKEKTYIGGTTSLEIKVKKGEVEKETVGLLLLVMKDVENGFLAVGGQTSIGRGLFAGNGDLIVDSNVTEKEYLHAAFAALRRE